MIIGIGVDLIEIERIEKALNRTLFLRRIFTEKEIEYFASRGYNPSTIAGSFAAKEAMSKALGTGIGKIGWHDMEVLRYNMGKPYMKLYGDARSIFTSMGGKKIHISISHSRLYAISQVIIEGD